MNTEKTYKDGVNEERQRILDILESFKNFYLRMTQCNNPYSCQMAAEKMETIDQVIDRIKQ